MLLNQLRLLKSFPSCLLACSAFCGCSIPSYQFGINNDARLSQSGAHIVVQPDSVPHPRLDKIEQTIFKPVEKIAKAFDKPFATGDELQTDRLKAMEAACTYLSRNGLDHIVVEHRAYQPKVQWQRLRANQTMHPIWKYTGGLMSFARSTILPPRVFRADVYNPYTQTLSLNSGDPLDAIDAASDGKLYSRSNMPGWKACSQRIPFVPVAFEVESSREQIGYARGINDAELESELYPSTFGSIGSEVVSSSLPVVIGGGAPFYVAPVAALTGGAVGHGVGTIVAPGDNR
jgi:hypothetical protein